MAGGGEAAALDGREMFAHAVHFGNVGAALEQRAIDRLLVLQGQPLGRQGQQRRSAARDEAQHEVIPSQALNHLEDALGGFAAGEIGNRVSGLHHFDALGRRAMSVARDHEPGQLAGPVLLDCARHRRSGLARTDDDGTAFGWIRQERRQAFFRHRARDGGVEHAAEQEFGVYCHFRL